MNKRILFIGIMLIVLCSFSAVGASEINSTDDGIGVDSDVLSAPSSVVSASEINSTDDGIDVDSDVLSAPSTSTITVYNWTSLKSACTNSTQYDTIYIGKSFEPENQISISKSVTIEGSSNYYIGGSSTSNITNAAFVPFYTTTNGLNITFKNLNFQNINVQYVSFMTKNVLIYLAGNGNYAFENCNFNNITGTGNKQSIIWLYKGTGNITNCNFTDNKLSYGTITNCFSTSSSTVNNARMSISDCRFIHNNGSFAPGAINNCGYMDIYNSVFENNSATNWAGAVLSYNYATTNIVNSSFKNNKAGWNGGAVYTYSVLNVANSIFEGNNCSMSAGGGAIGAISNGGSIFNITVRNCNFTNNRNNATGQKVYGGAISAMDNGYFHLYDSLFINNLAPIGRAISVKQGIYYDNDTYNSTYENESLGHPIFAIANNTFVDSDLSNISAIAYIPEDSTYILRPELHNNFTTSYAILGNTLQFNNIPTEDLLGISLDDSEIIGDGQDTPQWSMDGFDSSNSMESPYEGVSNGMLSWNKTYNNINALLIDKDGNILLERNPALTYLDNEGNQIRSVSINPRATDTSVYFDGITITPDNNIVLSEFVVSSSGFPINMYLSSYLPPEQYRYEWEYGNYDGDNLFLIDEENWKAFFFKNNVVYATNPNTNNIEYFAIQCDPAQMPDTYNRVSSFYITGSGPVINDIVDGIPESSSVIVADNKIWASNSNGFSIYDFSTVSSISASNIIGTPVADTNGNVYFFTSDGKISKADSTNGVTATATVTGGTGSRMALSTNNNALYSVNSLGTLYKYALGDLTETELTDIGATASTIMTDANGIIYVGSDDGKFYAFDDEGNEKWMVDTGSAFAVKNCAMDNEGNIYFYTADNALYAINEAPVVLKNISLEVTVPEGEFNVFDNVTITATLNETTDGNITFAVGDLTQTVAVNGSSAEWTTTVPSGNQTITATFEGNDVFATATNTAQINIAKVDVGFERVPESVAFVYGGSYQLYFDIVYNGANVTTGSIKGVDENGKQYTSMWRYSNNGWMATFRNMDTGTHTMTIVYSGDGNYNPANATLTVNVIPKVTAKANVVDDEVIVDVTLSAADATGNFTVMVNDESVAEGTIENGAGSASFAKMEPGLYDVKVIYSGDDNYLANNGTATFKIYATSQWTNLGYDAKGTAAANATRDVTVSVLWDAAIDGDLYSSPVIDSFGNIYLSNKYSVYAFSSDGAVIWSNQFAYDWGMGMDNFVPGLALYHDEVLITPVSGDRMILVDPASGDDLGGNYWSGSSQSSPILGPDGKVYTPSEYGYPEDGQGWSGNNWVSVFSENDGTYEFRFIVAIDGVPYGSPALKASPSLDGIGYIYVNTVDGFKIVNTETNKIVFNNPNINGVGRPVIDSNYVAYILDEDTDGIYAITTEGIAWNTTVTGGIGSTLAVDNENGFLYTVNAEGTLYKYATFDGAESEVYDLGSSGVSIILDAESNVYVSTDNGNVTAISAEGELLWTINLGSQITGQMAMNNDGVIYAVADETLYALGCDSIISVEVENLTTLDNEIITVIMGSDAPGNVSISVNGDVFEVSIENGTAILDLGKLSADSYDVSVDYAGNGIYGAEHVETAFKIVKANPNIETEVNSTVEKTTLTLTFPDDATGLVLVTVDGKGYFAIVNGSEVSFDAYGLKPASYVASIYYIGDDVYEESEFDFKFKISKFETPINIISESSISYGEDLIVVVQLPSEISRRVNVTVGDQSKLVSLKNGVGYAKFTGLAVGKYDITVTYGGDSNFVKSSASSSVSVTKATPKINVVANAVEYGEDLIVNIIMPSDISRRVKVSVDGVEKLVSLKSGVASASFKGLGVGTHEVKVSYDGDSNYAKATVTKEAKVNKGTAQFEITAPDIKVGETLNVAIKGPSDISRRVTVTVGDQSKMVSLKDGSASVKFTGLEAGKQKIVVSYNGDSNYKASENSTMVTVTA